MAFDHRLLDGCQSPVRSQGFDRDDVASVELKHESDAGVHREIRRSLIGRSSDEHRAGTAITLLAGDLRARLSRPLAQEFARGQEDVAALHLVGTTIHAEFHAGSLGAVHASSFRRDAAPADPHPGGTRSTDE